MSYPSIDGDVVGFTAEPAGGDYQVHLVRISDGAIFPASSASKSCFLANLRGDKIAYQCSDNVGSMEIYVTKFEIH